MIATQSLSRFRPTLEALDDRTLPAVTSVSFLDGHSPNSWKAGKDKVYIFAVEYEGDLTRSDAKEAWQKGYKSAMKKNISLDDPAVAVRHRTDDDLHLLMGWFNAKTKRGGYVAIDNGGSYPQLVPTGGFLNPGTRTEWHTTVNWVSTGSSGNGDEGWITRSWTTRNYHIDFRFAGDQSGDVVCSWTKPY
jgi:hypothetical protein